jgi:hypothetical protein
MKEFRMSGLTEELLDLREVARAVNARRPPHLSTVARWVQHGVKVGRHGRVRLASRRIGGRVFVSRAAVEAFLGALNGCYAAPAAPPPAPTAAALAAGEELRRRGA